VEHRVEFATIEPSCRFHRRDDIGHPTVGQIASFVVAVNHIVNDLIPRSVSLSLARSAYSSITARLRAISSPSAFVRLCWERTLGNVHDTLAQLRGCVLLLPRCDSPRTNCTRSPTSYV
jgi:hypothetical protein